MTFGQCSILVNGNFKEMEAKSVEISGHQKGLLSFFEMTQVFYHTLEESKEVSYVFSNDMKICIYDTTFVLGDEVIKPKLQEKKEAKAAFKEAVKSGRTAIFGTNLSHGMTEFKLGNLPPNTDCKVILKIAFTAQLTSSNTMFIKFPLDSYSLGGSRGCLNTKEFRLTLQGEKSKTKNITSNLNESSTYQNEDCLFTIISPEKKNGAEINQKKAIIITIEQNNTVESTAYVSKDCSAIIVSPNLPTSDNKNNEFIFLIDCSGSMSGQSIKKARECLEIFIRSLPAESYFNVIRFGSRYEKLFTESEKYNEETAQEAIELAQNMEANLGGTEIYAPLKDAFSSSSKNVNLQRQFFLLTDGEVSDTEEVINLVTENNSKNRCYTIGIGRGCDAGLIEGIATHSGGKSDFVNNNDSLAEKVIPQLESSLSPLFLNIEIHIEGNENIEVSPFPTPSINAKGAAAIFVHSTDSQELKGDILVTGTYGEETIDIAINKEENNEEMSNMENSKCFSETILALFSYNLIHKMENKREISKEEKAKIVELSIKSGVLCKYTAFIGISCKNNTAIEQDLDNKCSKNNYTTNKRRGMAKKKIGIRSNVPKSYRIAKKTLIYDSSSDSKSDDSDSDKNCKLFSDDQISEGSLPKTKESGKNDKHQDQEKHFMKKITKIKAIPKKQCADIESDDSYSSDVEYCPTKNLRRKGKKPKLIKKLIKKPIKKPIKEPMNMPTIKSKTISSSYGKSDDSDSDKNCKLFSDDQIGEGSLPKTKESGKNDKHQDQEKHFMKKITKIKAIPKKQCADIESDDSDDSDEFDSESSDDSEEKKKIECFIEKEKAAQKEKCYEAKETSEPKAKKSGKNEKHQDIPEPFDFISLTRYQTTVGFWNDLKIVNQFGNINIKKIEGIKKEEEEEEKKIIATIIAIALLRKKASDKKNIWKMIEKKAIEWLKTQIDGVDLETIICEIEKQIQ